MARATSFHASMQQFGMFLLIHSISEGLGPFGTRLQRDIRNITLFADSQVVEFYNDLRFEADPEGIKGMYVLVPRFLLLLSHLEHPLVATGQVGKGRL